MAQYGAMGAFVSNMAPIPMPPARQNKRNAHNPRSEASRSSSGSRAAQSIAARRPYAHSRTSSSSQASHSSHETAALHTDRPATTAGGGAGTGTAGGGATAGVGHPDAARTHADAHYSSSSSHHLQPPAASPRLGAVNKLASHMYRPRISDGLHPFDARNASLTHDHREIHRTLSAERNAESVSSSGGGNSLSARTMASSDPTAPGETPSPLVSRPFILRNGRTYLNDNDLPYPLPSDLTELHRQSLRTLLLIQIFGAPVCQTSLTKKPPQRVLEVGCGSGFWSMMCHRYFKGRGHDGISFTGIDVAPLAPGSATMDAGAAKPDPDMKWEFVNHDLRQLPWPLPDEEYDLVMVKDMSLATTNAQHQAFIDEYLRMLRPGGTLEVWESDHLIRMLRPHVPGASNAPDDVEEQETASNLGAYVMSANTPLSAPLNPFLVEYNHWLSRALERRDLSAVPCTVIGPTLLQESETLAKVRSRRLAIPLSEVRWEREGVGGIITKDGKSYVEMKGKGAPHQMVEKKTLTAGQNALRKTALLTVVQQVQALEPILRGVSGKSQDEMDAWLGKMMADLMSESGTSWGECLEVGAWWAKKKKAEE